MTEVPEVYSGTAPSELITERDVLMKKLLACLFAITALAAGYAHALDEETYVKLRVEMLREEIRHLKAMEKLLAKGDTSQSSIYENAFLQNQAAIFDLTKKYGATLKEYYEYPVSNSRKFNLHLDKSGNQKAELIALEDNLLFIKQKNIGTMRIEQGNAEIVK